MNVSLSERAGQAAAGRPGLRRTAALFLVLALAFFGLLSAPGAASASGHASATATLAAKRVALRSFSKVNKPTITGTARVGSKLKAHPGATKVKATSHSYRWYRNGRAISKATKSTYRLASADRGKRVCVKVTYKRAGYRAVAKMSACKGIKAKAKASSASAKRGVKPSGTRTCPAGYPIKGNINKSRHTMIYHVPGSRSYAVTNPEQCFATVAAARKAGYRAPIR